MTTYVVTTSNWNSAAFWNAIDESSSGHAIDFSGLPSTYLITVDSDNGRLTIDDGTTTYVVEDTSGTGPADATLGGATLFEYFDSFSGGAGDDDIYGGSGDDTISGGDGVNVLEGEDGDDYLIGNASSGGHTYLDGGDGADVLDGSAGRYDIASYHDSAQGVVIDLTDGAPESGGEAAGDTLIDIEQIDGSHLADDYIRGDDSGQQIKGWAGNDTLIGGAGDDRLVGGKGDDTLTGMDGADQFWGGLGSDTMYGDAGADTFYFSDNFSSDLIYGGTTDGSGIDYDTIDLSGLSNSVTLTETSGGEGSFTDGTDVASFWQIENYIGTDYDDIFNASAATDGVDIDAGGGSDDITGSAYDDTLLGGDGDDTIDGLSGDDTLSGGAGNDTLLAGVGSDDFDGGTGIDTVVIYGTDVETFGFTINLADGLDDQGNTYANIENVIGGLTADTLIGDSSDNILEGRDGDDTLEGGIGADTLLGEEGDDTINVAEGDVAQGGDGDDTFTLLDYGEDGQSDVTVDGGDTGESVGGGDVLRLAGRADMSTLTITSTTTNASGNTSYDGTVQMNDGSTLHFTGMESVVCFASGTQIATPAGPVPIERLRPGDLVLTRDNGPQPLIWIAARRLDYRELALNPHLKPITIAPALIGTSRPLRVSPQHGVLLRQDGEERLFRARHLAQLHGGMVREMRGCRSVTYLHLMFETHQVIFANDAASESFYPGPQAMRALHSDVRREVYELFPDLAHLDAVSAYGPTSRQFARPADLPPTLRALDAAP
ncbi:hypothetical protein E4Z66_03505 [Aliishimia ponticola]|uniref:Hedgehog/Intein (Hint) domain-containing protein n=1 Tax=Aliishimia ponticola TaxID=2499833 RepID=A0A4S4NK26_9RHOB|nr:Hint domain-containing protein [Aliishimia ponticola]THH38648.1 hypothetical protein E4Z66_03505 [Aliishimia ponticola]